MHTYTSGLELGFCTRICGFSTGGVCVGMCVDVWAWMGIGKDTLLLQRERVRIDTERDLYLYLNYRYVDVHVYYNTFIYIGTDMSI